MLTVFNRRELFTTVSMQKQAEIADRLDEAGLAFRRKTVNRQSPDVVGSPRARTGSYGNAPDIQYLYTFFVHRRDWDRARVVINRVSG